MTADFFPNILDLMIDLRRLLVVLDNRMSRQEQEGSSKHRIARQVRTGEHI